jgi:hypothetical protein
VTFLAPFAAVVAGAVALPALLVLYFLKLRRRQVRVGSTLLWWNAVQDLQVNTPFRWLRVSLLLILQLLALACLLVAIARPAIPDDAPAAPRVIIVIDRSASMNAADGVPPPGVANQRSTRLDEARRRADALVSSLARRSGGFGFSSSTDHQACILTLAARAEALTPFTASARELHDAIAAIAPSDQPADLPALLRLVDALAGASSDEAAPSQRTALYFFTDASFPAPPSPLVPPRNVDIRLERVGPAPSASPSFENLGVVSISARRDYDNPARLRVFARVLNASAAPMEAIAQLRISSAIADTRSILVPASARPAGPSSEVVPGETSVTFELEHALAGDAVVSITGAPRDLLAADDAAGLVLTPAGRARVLVVTPDATPPDTYLASALEALDLREQRTVSAPLYEEMILLASAPGGAPVGGPAPDLRDWDMVIFDRVTPAALPPPSLPSLSFGAPLPIPGVSIAAVEPPSTARAVSWQRTHPLLRYVTLDQLLVAPAVRLTLPTGPAFRVTPLAMSEDGPLIATFEPAAPAADAPARRIIVPFDIARSNWGPDVSFPVFLSNAVDYLTLRGQAVAGRSFRTTDPIILSPAPKSSSITIEGPVSRTIPVPSQSPGAPAAPVSVGQLDRAGMYTLTGATTPALAVNLLDDTETLLRTADDLPIAGVSRDLQSSHATAPREIWHYFAAAALALLTLEWFLTAWKMRV